MISHSERGRPHQPGPDKVDRCARSHLARDSRSCHERGKLGAARHRDSPPHRGKRSVVMWRTKTRSPPCQHRSGRRAHATGHLVPVARSVQRLAPADLEDQLALGDDANVVAVVRVVIDGGASMPASEAGGRAFEGSLEGIGIAGERSPDVRRARSPAGRADERVDSPLMPRLDVVRTRGLAVDVHGPHFEVPPGCGGAAPIVGRCRRPGQRDGRHPRRSTPTSAAPPTPVGQAVHPVTPCEQRRRKCRPRPRNCKSLLIWRQ
jgi:hypothetical protein